MGGRSRLFLGFVLAAGLVPASGWAQQAAEKPPAPEELIDPRRPKDEADLKAWLQNMVWDHGFTAAEVSAATGLSAAEVEAAMTRLGVESGSRPARTNSGLMRVLPYPGGRHPRIGFLDGALRPQRETKVSVFTPWDERSYVVVDVPEALWSNLGLTYLAHTHVPTVWSKQGIELPKQEWERHADGRLTLTRALPNGIRFDSIVTPKSDHVDMELRLFNGSDQALSDLRVQNCVMLKGAQGFAVQTNENKVIREPYVCGRSDDGKRWVITAWEPCHRPWANPPVPCLHSDPKFPDCGPGETRRLKGWLSFYEGTDLDSELKRIEATGWRAGFDPKVSGR